MKFPEKFIEKMSTYLGDEINDFIGSYDRKYRKSIRINRLKISVEEFLKISPFKLQAIPWTEDGFYVEEDINPSRHPYYYAGLYYIQEASAMAPVSYMEVEDGDVVLDLCSAPGGKTVQIASDNESGLIVANDISNGRLKAVVKNIEMYGIKNCVVINEDVEKINQKLSRRFDKILVDAPCSGEGMFKKDSGAVKAWESHGVSVCVEKQESIMQHIDELISGSGQIMYSTCTFSSEENEEQIISICEKENVEIKGLETVFEKGLSGNIDIDQGVARIWPHKVEGEGHFFARVQVENTMDRGFSKKETSMPEEFQNFIKENLNKDFSGNFMTIKDKLYLCDFDLDPFKGLRVIRSGWHLGELKRGRFIPSQALAMGLLKEDAKRVVNFTSDSVEVIKYLKGESIRVESEKGYNLILVDSYPIGWAKSDGKMLKNNYPSAWRML
ncbi:MAG: RsmF rRNA methyltransferase first C-terminal domain-containing protein [Firmicutes bacterium]|nr:RsmF rRNA methyltransferase first C-terminal domain-containing protein [Bacillota bacterium]